MNVAAHAKHCGRIGFSCQNQVDYNVGKGLWCPVVINRTNKARPLHRTQQNTDKKVLMKLRQSDQSALRPPRQRHRAELIGPIMKSHASLWKQAEMTAYLSFRVDPGKRQRQRYRICDNLRFHLTQFVSLPGLIEYNLLP